MIVRTASAVALLSLSACTFFVKSPPVASTGAVPIYDSTQIALDRYTVLKRLGVEDWESAFRIPGYKDLETAQTALVNEAGRLGADGVINVACFDQTDRIFNPAGYFCYGNAIKLKEVPKRSDEKK
jgi:hypothetical protein